MADDFLDPAFGVDDCPTRDAIRAISDKWKLLIVAELARAEMLRFRELQRRIAGVSQKVLTASLRGLESDGLVERTIYPEIPPRVEYRLNAKGRELLPILSQLQGWAQAGT